MTTFYIPTIPHSFPFCVPLFIMKLYLLMVLICISLMAYDVDTSSFIVGYVYIFFGEMSLQSLFIIEKIIFAHFVFLLLTCKSV